MTVTPVPVLLYHSVSDGLDAHADPWSVRVDDFRAHMEAVRQSGRTPVTAEQYGRSLRGEAALPARPMLVTFDDGFADFADTVLPILCAAAIPATLFVTTGWVGRCNMLSLAALRDMTGLTGIEVGAHSVSHPHLDVLRRDNARREIRDSKGFLEDHLQRSVASFAYPHGSHRSATRSLAVEAGFRNAHAVKNAMSHSGDDPLAVARFTVQGRTTRQQVANVINGGGIRLASKRELTRTRAYRLVRMARQWAAR